MRGLAAGLMLWAVAACSSSSRPQDAAPSDADAGPETADAEIGGVDVVAETVKDPGYPQWSSECETPNGSCPEGRCHRAILNVSATACGTFSTIRAGCTPNFGSSSGSACYVRKADGQIIITAEAPESMDGIEPCPDGSKPTCPAGTGFAPKTDPGYEQWTFPDCWTTDGSCPSDVCYRPRLSVSPTMCGAYTMITAGCRPAGLILGMAWIYVRKSDGEYIVTVDTPYTTDGLEFLGSTVGICQNDGGV